MEGVQSHEAGGSLQISSEVIEKIARYAALEVDGVYGVAPVSAFAQRGLREMITSPKAIYVEIKNDVADISVNLVVDYGTRIPELSERVQQSVKDAVQSMTSISVARVDVVIVGINVEGNVEA